MKSAYELAMERLEKSAPTVTLTDEQKAQIAEVDSSYRAKIAEKELFLQEDSRGRVERQFRGGRKLERQLATELRRLHEDWEERRRRCARGLETGSAHVPFAGARPKTFVDVARTFLLLVLIVRRGESVTGSG
jgi:hypothetical protein